MNFERLYEFKKLCTKFEKPCDCYFHNLDDLLKDQNTHYTNLAKELNRLDEISWKYLKEKCSPYLCLNNKKRGWEQLFNILNEAKGYGYLLDKGCNIVQFISTSRKGEETPDLEGSNKGAKFLCEVKTLNKSDCEIERREKRYAKGVEFNLNEGLQSQLKKIINKAKSQLLNYQVANVKKRIVYIIVCNNDWQPDVKSRIYRQTTFFVKNFIEKGIEIKIHFI